MASFADDFNRADSTNLGAGWVEVSGDWSIVSNQLSPGSDGGTIILRAAGAMDSSDHSAQVTIAATTAASHGVWCRGNSGFSSGYLWRNDGSEWTLFSVASSTFTAIGSYTAAAAPGDIAKLQTVGSTIKGYVNGVQRVSVTDTAVPTGTSVGLRTISSGAIRFDDFTAADITAGVNLGTATETAAAQPLTANKAAAIGPAAAVDAAHPLAGSKAGALALVSEGAVAQSLGGAKTAAAPAASQTETAGLLTGAKSANLGAAVEAGTARSLADDAPNGNIDVAVGAPATAWAVSGPSRRWEVSAPW
ncbi:hypothetical protein AB0C77_06645 [Streptomyces sp. NPDC048629]|uniref:hypothetical protein n=1 Tax=Streptomyces sp. NPDC048629 TaxID=3154824 RepID=UPI0034131B7C